MKKTKYNMTLDMVLQYAKVFDQEGKPGDIDRGDASSDLKWMRELAKNPEAKVNCYFTSEEQIEYLTRFKRFQRFVKNPQTGEEVDRIKEGDPDLGIGLYIQLKRKLVDIREYKDKDGVFQEMDKGGYPTVKILSEDGTEYVDYDYEEHGSPSNGTLAKVRFEPAYMRIDAIAITELVEWVEGQEEDDF